MHTTHKIRMYPNNRQATYLARCCGVARFAYNWGLARWNEQYETHRGNTEGCPSPNRFSLNKELNAVKREQFPWMLEVTKYAPQAALINLGKAFDSFFKKRGRHPQFKRKGEHDSFYIGADQFEVEGNHVKIPGLSRFMGGRRKCGWVRMAEGLRFKGAKIVRAVVSRVADEWYVAVTCEVEEPASQVGNGQTGIVGVDVGVGEYVTSDGEFHKVPRSYRSAMRRLRRAQQSLSRKVKGSRNRWKQRIRVAKIHHRIADIRGDWLHKLTAGLTKRYGTIVIEDLNVKGMVRNGRLAVSIMDAGFGEFRRMLEYKSKRSGCSLVVADRWYPSSKTCSNCGEVKAKLPLGERVFRCGGCGFICHRDLNAAINLKNLAASSAVTACGEFSASGFGQSSAAKHPLRSRKKASCLIEVRYE